MSLRETCYEGIQRTGDRWHVDCPLSAPGDPMASYFSSSSRLTSHRSFLVRLVLFFFYRRYPLI